MRMKLPEAVAKKHLDLSLLHVTLGSLGRRLGLGLALALTPTLTLNLALTR